MKKGLFIAMGLCYALGLAAQQDTTYYNTDWDTVPSSEGAAYFRLFDKLDNATKLYYFINYYISGEKQSVCSYLDPKGIKKSGEWVWYHKNGQVSKTGTYTKGYKKGDWYEYFDNGDLKSKLTHVQNEEGDFESYIEYVELYDEKSREHILIGGEGLYITYHDNGDTNTVGKVAQKRKTGTWKEYRENGELYYIEEYKAGNLKSGISYDKFGKKYTYKEIMVKPSYVGGQEALLRYLGTIAYPKKAREDDMEGTVYVQFVVDKEGYVTEVTVVRSSGWSILDDAAKNHVSTCRKWIPGLERGQTTRVQYVVPMKFKLTDAAPKAR